MSAMRLFADAELSRDAHVVYYTIAARVSQHRKAAVGERGKPYRFRRREARDAKLREIRQGQRAGWSIRR